MSNPLDEVAWPVRTDRCTLRRAVIDDVEPIRAVRAIDGVSTWLSTDATDRERFERHFARPDRLAVAIVVELDGVIAGDVMMRVHDAWTQTEVADGAAAVEAELGWVLDPALRGRGVATELVSELLRIGFDDLGLRRLTAECYAENEPSWRLMERVGMRRERHTVADALHRSGRWLDTVGYAILADEWRDRR